MGEFARLEPDGALATIRLGRYAADSALRAAKQAIGDGLDAGLEIERLHLSRLPLTEDRRAGRRSSPGNGRGKATFTGRSP
jgi:hypothetical protein